MDEIVSMQISENITHLKDFSENRVSGVKENRCVEQARGCDSGFYLAM